MEFDNATNLDRKSSVPGKMMICFHCFPEGRNRIYLPVDMEKQLWGLRPLLFRPTYAGANVGHPSRLCVPIVLNNALDFAP